MIDEISDSDSMMIEISDEEDMTEEDMSGTDSGGEGIV